MLELIHAGSLPVFAQFYHGAPEKSLPDAALGSAGSRLRPLNILQFARFAALGIAGIRL